MACGCGSNGSHSHGSSCGCSSPTDIFKNYKESHEFMIENTWLELLYRKAENKSDVMTMCDEASKFVKELKESDFYKGAEYIFNGSEFITLTDKCTDFEEISEYIDIYDSVSNCMLKLIKKNYDDAHKDKWYWDFIKTCDLSDLLSFDSDLNKHRFEYIDVNTLSFKVV